MKLLIVDDSFIMRKTIEKCALELGIEKILTAPNGKSGLDLFMKERPPIVTMDITMPEMDGLSCLDAIMKINPAAKVIVITALKDSTTGLEAVKKGAKGFLPKPFTPVQLKEELTAVIGGYND
jgi:two-component system chemotaxis response regulator CheY